MLDLPILREHPLAQTGTSKGTEQNGKRERVDGLENGDVALSARRSKEEWLKEGEGSAFPVVQLQKLL